VYGRHNSACNFRAKLLGKSCTTTAKPTNGWIGIHFKLDAQFATWWQVCEFQVKLAA